MMATQITGLGYLPMVALIFFAVGALVIFKLGVYSVTLSLLRGCVKILLVLSGMALLHFVWLRVKRSSL